MRFFLHNSVLVRLSNGLNSFECTPERFFELEPDYPALAEGRILRYWTNERQYESDQNGINYPCTVDCSGYVDNLANYTVYPQIFAHVNLSQDSIQTNADPEQQILFDCHLKASPDPASADIPIDYAWKIRLTHEAGVRFDAILVNFVQGEATSIYRYGVGIPHGDWYVDENLFDLVEFGGVLYQVKLVNPVKFTLYRSFA